MKYTCMILKMTQRGRGQKPMGVLAASCENYYINQIM